ncbi:DNA polymerase III subunit delta [Chondrinema litorale]|uniref:DNA polymerase III subunit delta n=1 Tax=Chondrinema litorale TaxID=2994555 RepID=UPI0025432EA4|nr:DNA polymerase III subunit delta [Chondrinema litorale]UZR94437.1 DNA polymerase III subunit delta [Chondrinema litorale]
MAVSAFDILNELKKGKYAPLYFLYGDEPFFIDKISEYIEEHALTISEKGFNQTIIYGKDLSIGKLLESARSFPMMAKRQVIIIKEAQAFQDISKKDGQDLLAKYAQNPTPTTILVFCYKHKKPDARTEMFKVLNKHAVLVESKKIYDDKLPGWIKQYFKEINYSIQEKAAFMMAEFIGNDLSRITNEADKMVINYPENTELTSEHILKHIGISKEFNVFELQTALAKKDVLKANKIINYFASNPKDNPLIPIISLLYNYFTKILLLHDNKGASKDELARKLRISPYFLTEYQTAARNYPVSKVLNNIHYIHQADLYSKGIESVKKDSAILKELIFKILH